MIRRLLFFVFFCLGGFFFYIPKWILVGTKGERQRKASLKELRQIRKAAVGQPFARQDPPENPGYVA